MGRFLQGGEALAEVGRGAEGKGVLETGATWTVALARGELMAELGLQDMSCEPQGNTVPGPPPAPLHPFLLEQSSTKGP